MKVYKADVSSMFVEVGDAITVDSEEHSSGLVEVKVLQIIKADFRDEVLWFYGCETDRLD